MSALAFSTIALGVPAGTTIPTVLNAESPGTVSATMGMSGTLAGRLALNSAILLSLPALMSGAVLW